MADIDVPAELHDPLVQDVLSGLGDRADSPSDTEVLDAVYFRVYTDPEMRKAVGYHHPLDTFR